MEPLLFAPFLRPMVWGGRRLATRLNKRLPDDQAYGESWELSAHSQHASRVVEGPFQGQSLAELWAAGDRRLWGDRPRGDRFPLLFKFLDCHALLSVQVHPDDALARQLLGNERGKTEAWVILEASPEAVVYAGLRPGVTRGVLEEHLDRGTVADCLHAFRPQVGDCVFLPAGTVHAVGGGIVMAEVQQTSDATFRLFDWNRLGTDGRPRALHRTESLAAIDFARTAVEPVTPEPQASRVSGNVLERLVACEHFVLDRWRLTATEPLPSRDEWRVVMVIDGAAELVDLHGRGRRCEVGQTLLIPASAEGWSWRPLGASTLLVVEPGRNS